MVSSSISWMPSAARIWAPMPYWRSVWGETPLGASESIAASRPGEWSRKSTMTPRPSAAMVSIAASTVPWRTGSAPMMSSMGLRTCMRTSTGPGAERSPFERIRCSEAEVASVNTRSSQSPPWGEWTGRAEASRTRLSWRRR